MAKIAVFGSAFNPPTLGHKSVIESLLHFDQVLLVPSIAHAWGKSMLDFDVRCGLVNAFIGDLNLDRVAISRIEQQLHNGQESVTTYQLLEALAEQLPGDSFTFVVGPDNFLNFAKFYRFDDILQRHSVLACPEKVAVRSTMIREQIAKHASIDSLTTPSVAKYIQTHQLYAI